MGESVIIRLEPFSEKGKIIPNITSDVVEDIDMSQTPIIFVTVGTGNVYGFERLIRKMDEIAEELDDIVVMQIGCTNYEPKNAKYFRFISKKDMDRFYATSKVVVCHAGIGSIISVMKFNKPAILVPRKRVLNEHIDDHQAEIAKFMENKMRVVYDIDDLEILLRDISSIPIPKFKTDRVLIDNLGRYFEELEFDSCKRRRLNILKCMQFFSK